MPLSTVGYLCLSHTYPPVHDYTMMSISYLSPLRACWSSWVHLPALPWDKWSRRPGRGRASPGQTRGPSGSRSRSPPCRLQGKGSRCKDLLIFDMWRHYVFVAKKTESFYCSSEEFCQVLFSVYLSIVLYIIRKLRNPTCIYSIWTTKISIYILYDTVSYRIWSGRRIFFVLILVRN